MKNIIIGSIMVLLMGCSSSGVGQTEEVQVKSPSVKEHKLVNKSVIKETKTSKDELVLVLCSAQKLAEAKSILKKYKLQMVKQSSPTIMTVASHGEQSSQELKEILLKESSVFCQAQENYKYHTMQSMKNIKGKGNE